MAKKKTSTKKTATGRRRKKTVRRKRATKRTATAAAAVPKVRVRMFRPGLGDCFLVTFDADGDERHLLIDCGTLGNKAGSVKIADIADHLETLLGADGKLDALVATHEHQDHLSGFKSQLKPVLKDRVEHVWLAWTEDPEDTDAQELQKYQGDLVTALANVVSLAQGTPVGERVAGLLGFSGETVLGSFAKTVDAAMKWIRDESGGEVRYLEPGNLIEEDWLPGFRIYVLGPPRDTEAIKELGSHESEELYHIGARLGRAAAAHLAAAGSSGGASDWSDGERSTMPFDERFWQRGDALLEEQYPRYGDPDEEWRRVDYEWLNVASDLALQLDSFTNNTSLVLAIERIADGKVLLFPADAQQGNWLSWHDEELEWLVIDGAGELIPMTAADLLKNTVFYKVGHHGSHNATAKGKGLELMTRIDELVAFIPVDREIALGRSPKGTWRMPARALYRRLLEKCNGRVVRADLGWAVAAEDGDEVEQELFDLAGDADWQQWAQAQDQATNVDLSNPLYVEYVLE